MARKSKKLEELKNIIEDYDLEDIDIEEMDTSVLKELVIKVSGVSDVRDEAYIRHSLSDIIMITLLGVLTNANEWSEIEAFAKKKEKWLRKFLELRNGVPTDDTYRKVISMINVKYLYGIILDFFIKKFHGIIEEFKTEESEESKEIMPVDGKVTCSSKRDETDKKGRKALNTLSAYSSDWGVCIDQEFIEEKTNEITSMPILLKRLDLKNTIVTWDALNTQKEIVATVIEGKGDYVGALKGNQHNFYEDVKDFFNEEEMKKIKSENKKYKKTVEKEHSSIVTREYFISNDIKWLYNKEKWKGLKAIGLEYKTIEKLNSKKAITNERRYFICSFDEIEDFARSVREHWGIENRLHWQLDFTFKDDKNTTMKNNGAEGLQIFKKLALAILKFAQPLYPKRTSLKKIRYYLALDYEKEIEKIFTMLSIEKLKELAK